MEYLVGDNVYPIWIDSRNKDDGPMIDWQFKIMDYVYDMLESLPYGTAAIISKKSFTSMYALNVKFGVLSVVGVFGLYLRC